MSTRQSQSCPFSFSLLKNIRFDTAIILNEILPSRIKFHIIVFDHNLEHYI